jgi:hypothetical protein
MNVNQVIILIILNAFNVILYVRPALVQKIQIVALAHKIIIFSKIK